VCFLSAPPVSYTYHNWHCVSGPYYDKKEHQCSTSLLGQQQTRTGFNDGHLGAAPDRRAPINAGHLGAAPDRRADHWGPYLSGGTCTAQLPAAVDAV
jgi:hypothetical protein